LQRLEREYSGESKGHEELSIYPDARPRGEPICTWHRMLLPDSKFQYGTLQFGKFEEIQKKAYQAAIDILEKFDDEGRLPPASIDSKDGLAKGRQKGKSARRNSI
jgi:hypothetical protein